MSATGTNYYLQVWAGKEGCEPVTWQECKLVDKVVHFRVPEVRMVTVMVVTMLTMMMVQVNCSAKEELWYHVPENVTLTRTTNTLTCEVTAISTGWSGGGGGGVQILFMNHCTIVHYIRKSLAHGCSDCHLTRIRQLSRVQFPLYPANSSSCNPGSEHDQLLAGAQSCVQVRQVE